METGRSHRYGTATIARHIQREPWLKGRQFCASKRSTEKYRKQSYTNAKGVRNLRVQGREWNFFTTQTLENIFHGLHPYLQNLFRRYRARQLTFGQKKGGSSL